MGLMGLLCKLSRFLGRLKCKLVHFESKSTRWQRNKERLTLLPRGGINLSVDHATISTRRTGEFCDGEYQVE